MKEEITQKILSYIEGTKDFVLEQLPDVIQQALKYEKICAILWIALLSVFIPCLIIFACYSYKHPVIDKYGSLDTFSCVKIVLPCFFLIPSVIGYFGNIFTLLKICIAPKYYLISFVLKMKG